MVRFVCSPAPKHLHGSGAWHQMPRLTRTNAHLKADMLRLLACGICQMRQDNTCTGFAGRRGGTGSCMHGISALHTLYPVATNANMGSEMFPMPVSIGVWTGSSPSGPAAVAASAGAPA